MASKKFTHHITHTGLMLGLAWALHGCGPGSDTIAEVSVQETATFADSAAEATVDFRVRLLDDSGCSGAFSSFDPEPCEPVAMSPSSHEGDVEAGPAGALADLQSDETAMHWTGRHIGHANTYEVLFREGWATDTLITIPMAPFPKATVSKTSLSMGETISVTLTPESTTNVVLRVRLAALGTSPIFEKNVTLAGPTTIEIDGSIYPGPGNYEIQVAPQPTAARTITPAQGMRDAVMVSFLITQDVQVTQ